MKQAQVESILKEIETIRKHHENDHYFEGGRELLLKQIEYFINDNKRIIAVLPSFPFKSQNRDNTLGDLPDMGEYIALKTLNAMCLKINSIYEPGIDLYLASDGRLYSDLVCISDEQVSKYRNKLLEMNTEICSESSLKWFSLDEGIGETNGQDIRTVLENKYSDGIFDVRDKIKTDLDYLRLYIGFKAFALGELNSKGLKCSNREKVRRAVQIAERMMIRNFSNAKLLKEKFPKMIRFSVKYHDTRKGIFAVNLMNKQHDVGTPWLNSIVKHNNNDYAYIKAKDARLLGYKEVRNGNLPYLFKEI